MELGSRRHNVACLVHAELSLHSSCVRATDPPQYVRRTCPVRPRAHNALPPRIFALKTTLPLVMRASHVISALFVLTRHFLSSPVQKYAQNSGGPYRASTYSALTMLGVRTELHPTATEINVRLPHLDDERVRTLCVFRTYNALCGHNTQQTSKKTHVQCRCTHLQRASE